MACPAASTGRGRVRASARRGCLACPSAGGHKRVLIYSHDSFGLGHVSRCRTIANAIVRADPRHLGSDPVGLAGDRLLRVPLGHRFRAHPGRGEAAATAIRPPTCKSASSIRWRCARRIIRDTADIYRPDLFIVDKEPLGLRGEVVPALTAEGARHAAGARPARRHGRSRRARRRMGAQERRAGAARSYDEIWIYGLPQINKPLPGIEVPPSVRQRSLHGYLRRDLPLTATLPHEPKITDGPSSWSPPAAAATAPT